MQGKINMSWNIFSQHCWKGAGIQINIRKGSGYAQIQLLREGNTTSNSNSTGYRLGVSLKSVFMEYWLFDDKRIWSAFISSPVLPTIYIEGCRDYIFCGPTLKLASPWFPHKKVKDFGLLTKISSVANRSLWYLHILFSEIIFTKLHHFNVF